MTPTAGGGPSFSLSVNANNQIEPANVQYDGNGNITQFDPSGSLNELGYDVSNRIATVDVNQVAAPLYRQVKAFEGCCLGVQRSNLPIFIFAAFATQVWPTSLL
jgi:hypothetical protein